MMKPKLISIIVSILLLFFITSAYGRVSKPFPIANKNEEYEFAVSFASDGEKFLVPVMHQKPSSSGLYAQFVNLNGTLGSKVTIEPLSYTKGFFGGKVAYGEGRYLVVWTEIIWSSGSTSVKGVFINSNGTKGNVFTIASNITNRWEWYILSDVSFGGGKFLVVYEKPVTINNETHLVIFGRFITSETNISNEFQVSQRWGSFNLNHVSYGDGKFLVVYRDDKDDKRILARFVNPSTSAPTGSEIVIDDDHYYSDSPLSVLFDGGKFFTVWADQVRENPSIWKLKGRFVYPNGTVSQNIINISEVNAWTGGPFIAFDGTKYLVTWTDGRNCGVTLLNGRDESFNCIRSGLDIYGRYISKEGTFLGNEFVISSLPIDELGGFYGIPVKGKIFGLINKRLSFVNGIFTSEDVDGMFLITSGYSIFAPNNREKVYAGNSYTIRWRTPPQAVKFDIAYSNDNKNTWTTIAQNVTTKSYNWTVPAQNGRKPNSFIRIVAYDSGNTRIATFDSRPFLIEVIKITQPNGGELLKAGQSYQIRWQTSGLSTTVAKTTVQYTTDGTTWINIRTVNGNPGSVNWTVPTVNEIKSTCKIRVIFKNAAGQTIAITESDAVFTIMP